MLNRLVDLIVEFLYLFQFWYIVEPYQQAVRTTLGENPRSVGPGFHLKWPFRIDAVIEDNVVMQTVEIQPQSLTTKDGVSVVVTPEALFHISDLKIFSMEMVDGEKVIINVIKSKVSEYFREHTWEEIERNASVCDEITTKCRYFLTRRGVTIDAILLSDMVRADSYRLWQTQSSTELAW